MFFESRRYVVGFAPEGVAIRCAGQPMGDHAIVVDPKGEDGWHAAVPALGELLQQHLSGKGRLSIVLSHHLVQFLAVPWSDAMLESRGRQVYLRDQFAMAFGEVASKWLFTVEEGGRGLPRIACAIDRELIDTLREAARANNATIESMIPWLVTVLNRFRRKLGAEGWFVAVEPQKLALVELRAGITQRVTYQHWEDDWSIGLAQALRRAVLRAGREEGLPVWVANTTATPSPAIEGIHMLPIVSDAEQKISWPMALTGVMV